MKIGWLRVALLCLVVAIAAGCSSDGGSSPFVGDWVSDSGSRLSFTDSTWSDSDGDSGSYSFSGDYPVYTLNLDTETRRFIKRATFADVNTMEMCSVSSTGTVGACVNLAFDKPTLH